MTTKTVFKRGDDGLLVPGYGMPISFFPSEYFPFLMGEEKDWNADTLTIREVCMLKLMEDLTNKPEWWRKVNDPEIAAKWKKEAIGMPWEQYRTYGDFTEEMADACMEELQKKAELYEKTGLIPVMDYSACAIKSDKLVPDELREALKSAVAPLENVPEARKDWHPGSDGKVLDLVHPSLWPLVYGRSRVLTNKRIAIDDCLNHCGSGDILTVPDSASFKEFDHKGYNLADMKFSTRFQWLPCDVDISGDHPRIESYINNLHPVQHAQLYPILEKFIAKALPAWDIVYRWPEEFSVQRVHTDDANMDCSVEEICFGDDYGNYCCQPWNRPLNEGEAPREDDEEDEDDYKGSERQRLDNEWFQNTHKADLPNPKEDIGERIKLDPSHVKTTGFFNDASRVQVIIKLANIHLTPEKPKYDGGSWHVEGQLNEHICATALYYYDSDNITDCHLDLRTCANREELSSELGYAQGDFAGIERVFDIRAGGNTIQNIGSVLTRSDRMLFFPNVYQHHVSPFELTDKTRSGHRKILAMFLVDPEIPVISTANVPPQQQSWWSTRVTPLDGFNNLPAEVANMVMDNVDFPISEKDAKKIREELMEERTRGQEATDSAIDSLEWNFCEH